MNSVVALVLGDIFGKAGRRAIHSYLPTIKEKLKPDIIIANAENVAGGFGITENLATKLLRYGIDVITLGNHTWNKREELRDALDKYENILRPANYPPNNPGHGSTIFTLESGIKIGVINLMGRVFMPSIDCPFRIGSNHVERLKEETEIILIDFHAEATSEKVAAGYFFDGRSSAVFGTHTHIQTVDNKILKGGTAYITDLGMTGPHDSVIGIKPHLAIEHLINGVQVRFEPSDQGTRIQGAIIKIDSETGKAISIDRIDMPVMDYDIE